jgi:acyl-CoA reductase-like NAD-dependent aldehyde dehydrogenase
MLPRVEEPGMRDYWAGRVLNSGIGRKTLERLAALVKVLSPRAPIAVPAPFTGQILATIPACAPEDVSDAVRLARSAQPSWAARSFADRRSILLRFHDLLLDRQEQALDLIQLESGKARLHALEEVIDTALVARHYGLHAEEHLRPRRHPGALPALTTAWEHRHPVGVVGFIAPWNFPLILGVTDLIPALMAGNSAVLRPDVQSSFTALWAADLLYEAGLPREVLRVVTGRGRVLGPLLINSVDFVMFTGSTATGRQVGRQAAERLIGFSLELGGKNPMIVLEDADLDAAVDGLVRGAFVGAGQVCESIERAFVHSSIFDAFTRRFVERVTGMKLSGALEYGVDMGSLTTAEQLAAVAAHVEDAVSKGAVLLAGGRPRPDLGPLFFEPTVLAEVTPAMRVYAEETFGPVVSLYEYSATGEAIERANDTSYGLNASVWSNNVRQALEVARRIRAGTVNVNEVYAATWTATSSPIGGMKESGFGRRHGAEGILKYTEAQTIAVQRWLPLAPPRFMSEERYGTWMPRILRLLRHMPRLRRLP